MFNIFGNKPQEPQQQQQGQQPQQPNAQNNLETPPAVNTKQDAGTAPNGVVPDNVPENNEPASPLEPFKDLWETTANKEGEEGQQQQQPSLDPEALQKAVSKISFESAVTPEVLQSITAGGEDAAAAFMQALNSVAQQAVVQSTLVSNKLAEQAAQRAREEALKEIPTLIKKQGLAENLATANPLFNDPAVKPVLESVQQQLAVKFPSATTAELTKMAQDYVTAMAQSFSPASNTPTNPLQQAEETDWSKFLAVN